MKIIKHILNLKNCVRRRNIPYPLLSGQQLRVVGEVTTSTNGKSILNRPAQAAVGLFLCWSSYWIYNHNRKRASRTCYARERVFMPIFSNKNEIFFEMCKDGNLEMLKSLVSYGQDVNERHLCGWTALMVAAVNGQIEVVKFLLENGANPDLQDEYDSSVKRGGEESIYVMTEKFHLMNDRHQRFSEFLDDNLKFVGYTALHYAAYMKYTNIVKLLYDFGADGSLVNSSGLTAAELATGVTRELAESYEAIQKQKRNPEVYKKVKLKDILRTELVGQELAIDQVTGIISRLETGWVNSKHPTVLMFVGATGLGKTEMAKILAKYMRGNVKDAFLNINLSEYQTANEAAKFTGAPPGYIGYSSSSEGQLISMLDKHPRAIVLFDEADKAHPDVLATLLQLFDEGRLTSGSGKTVECNEAVFIMTANLAVSEIKDFGATLRQRYHSAAGENTSSSGDAVSEQEFVQTFKTTLLHGSLKEAFKRDELLGRINELAIFLPFSSHERKEIIEHQLRQVRRIASRSHGVALSWDSPVLDILDAAFNELYGARNMRHEIDRKIVSKLSAALEHGLYHPGDFLHIETGHRLGETDGLRGFIRLYKVSPLGEKNNLDIQFSDLSELFNIKPS